MSDLLMYVLWFVKATALLLLAMGLTMALRRAPAGARYLVWLGTLAALLLIPAMSAWSPLSLPILPSETPAIDARTTPIAAPVTPSASETTPPSISPPAASTARETMAPSSIAFAVWGSMVALLLAWLMLGALSVRRIMRRARTLTDRAWLTPLYETADRLDLDRVPRLVMSSAIEMPFACSILNPTIVLPVSAEQWSDERRRVVLFHELAHISRRDLLGHTLGRVVCAFYWFHPLVWTAAKQLRAESERACDDLVLSCGARASDYANHLLEIVTGVRRYGAPATALPMANKREFEGRMLAILDPAVKRATPSRGQKLVLTIGLGAVALTIAAVSPTRRAGAASDLSSRSLQSTAFRDSVLPIPAETLAERARTKSPRPSASVTASSTETVTVTATSIATASASASTSSGGRLMQQGSPADTALLGRVLRTDTDARVRRAAAWALQGRRDAVPLLLERIRVDEDENVREMSVWALAGLNSTEIAAGVAEALRKDGSADVRGTAAWALGHMRGNHIAILEGALGDESADVRQRALWALGQRELASAPARVLGLLKDPDHDVRLMAAWVLGQILDKSTIPALREAFTIERNSNVQEAVFRALMFMGDRSQPVIDRAMSSTDPEMRAHAVRMIAGLGPGVWPWPWPWPDPRPEP